MDILKISAPSTLWHYIRGHRLPAMRIGKKLLFNKEKLEKWLKDQERESERDLALR